MAKLMYLAVPLLLVTIASARPPAVEHGVIYAREHEFAGWPANEGLWAWGDEVLVAFNVTQYLERDDMHNQAHDADMWVAFARSIDGGATWTIEEHPEVSTPARLTPDGRYVRVPDAPPIPRPRPYPGGVDFTSPGFALKVRNDTFFVSADRGRYWDGPFILPNPTGALKQTARTNYLVVDRDTLRIFHSVALVPRDEGEHGRTLMLETNDGGKTFEFVSWLTDDPREFERDTPNVTPAYSIMPGVTTLDDGSMLVAIRNRVARHKWVDLLASNDDGRTWEVRSRPFDHNNNPASLVNLGGNNLAIIYGWRNKPFGIRAKVSEDAGRTWSQEIVLRDDAREWDLGYVRAALRPDRRILVVYYYTTEDHPAEFIASTIWNPPVKVTRIVPSN